MERQAYERLISDEPQVVSGSHRLRHVSAVVGPSQAEVQERTFHWSLLHHRLIGFMSALTLELNCLDDTISEMFPFPGKI